MALAQADTPLSAHKLFKTIESMPPAELGRLFVHILAVQAQHKAPRLAATESQLLLRINKGGSPQICASVSRCFLQNVGGMRSQRQSTTNFCA